MFGMSYGIGLSFVAMGVRHEKETETDIFISVPEELYDETGRQEPLTGKKIASAFAKVVSKRVRYRMRKGERMSFEEGRALAKKSI